MKILIVDDSSNFRLVAKEAIDSSHHMVIEAEDGYEALSLAYEERPDLILTDVDMPNLNGIRLTEVLSERGFKVCIMTGNDSMVDEAMARVSGANGFVVKGEHLKQDIQRVVGSIRI